MRSISVSFITSTIEVFSAGATHKALSTTLTSCRNFTKLIKKLAIGPGKRLQNFSINLPASHVSLHSFEQELYSQSGLLLLLPATQNTYFSLVRDTNREKKKSQSSSQGPEAEKLNKCPVMSYHTKLVCTWGEN